MQLLKITNIPIQFNYSTTPGRLEMHRTPNPVQHMEHDPAQLKLKARNIQVRMDTTEMRARVTIPQIIRQKMLEQPTTYTTYLPPVGADISWQPEELQINYDPGTLNFDWKLMSCTMNYIPSSFQFNVTQYPKVNIEYLGEPTYVPPSSKPSY